MNNTGLLFSRSWQCSNKERVILIILRTGSQGGVVNTVIEGHSEFC